MNIIHVNIAINVTAIIFYIFLVVIYLTKKNMNNLDNKIFRQLLIWNFLMLVLHLLYLSLGLYLPELQVYEEIVASIYLGAYVSYYTFLTCYIVVLSLEKNEKVTKFINLNSKFFAIIIFVFLIFMLFSVILLPIKVEFVGNGLITSGLASDFVQIFNFFALIIIFGTILKNSKIIERKKLIPFYSLGIMVIVSLILFSLFPSLCGMVLLVTIITYLMYHTIENPDMRQSAELQLAKDAAEKANNAKSDFLSSMSHEIRTPLNAIVGLSQVMMGIDDVNEIRTDLKDIVVESQKLLDLVNGILDINKLETNQIEIVDEVYNPREVFNSLTYIIKLSIGSKPLVLNTNFSSELPTKLYGDKEKIKRIILNLLTNAIKYTDKVKVEFNVDCIVDKGKCNLIFNIKDTGRGIKEDQKDYLFTKFYRLEKDKDSNIGGTGLGLAITKSLVDLLGGEISFTSKLGEGSTFTVKLVQQVLEKSKQNIKSNSIDSINNNLLYNDKKEENKIEDLEEI